MSEAARSAILARLRAAGTCRTGTLACPDASEDRQECLAYTTTLRARMEAVHTEFLEATRESWRDVVAAALPGLRILYPGQYTRPIEEWKAELFADIDAAVTTTRGAIAETGSLIVWPSPEEPRLLSLVPPIHVALLDVETIVGTLEEAFAGWAGHLPPNALLISGPSKTADIEQTLAYGVHGPKRLIVVLIAE